MGVGYRAGFTLAFAVKDACPRLQVLGAQELGQINGHRIRGARHNGLRLALGVLVLVLMMLMLMLVVVALSLSPLLLLLLLGHHGGLLLPRPLLKVLDELGD